MSSICTLMWSPHTDPCAGPLYCLSYWLFRIISLWCSLALVSCAALCPDPYLRAVSTWTVGFPSAERSCCREILMSLAILLCSWGPGGHSSYLQTSRMEDPYLTGSESWVLPPECAEEFSLEYSGGIHFDTFTMMFNLNSWSLKYTAL